MMKGISFCGAVFLLAARISTSIAADCESPTCQSEDGDNFSAIGLGVSNLDASTRFYTAVFDYRNATRLDLPNWTEDILLSNGNATGSYAIVTMRWKEAQPRNVRDLPIKLRFKVPDPRATQRLVARSGGKSLPLHYNHGDPHSKAVYATDPDGYLIELLPAGGHGSGTGLVSAGLGTSNLEASAGFWGAVTGNAATTIKGTRRWRSITINPDTDSGRTALELLDWKERPARPTDRLPIKVVVRTRSAAAFVSRVVQAGGQVVLPPGPMQGIVVGFCRDPVDQTLIEINEFPSFRIKQSHNCSGLFELDFYHLRAASLVKMVPRIEWCLLRSKDVRNAM